MGEPGIFDWAIFTDLWVWVGAIDDFVSRVEGYVGESGHNYSFDGGSDDFN